MGHIEVEHKGLYYEFEKSDDETENILRVLTGARTIKPINEQTFEHAAIKIESASEITDKTEKKTAHNPTSKEITAFILSRPEYKHTTREILAYYNKDVDIADISLSKGAEDFKNAWRGVLQKLRHIHKKLEKSENGKWETERIGLETEYTFKKY